MIDLHTHSTASDGTCTPERLVALALEAGLAALALTDHDTLAGIERAREAAAGTGLRLIAGVEIEIARETGEFHLLGLGFSQSRDGLEAALTRVRADRNERNLLMVARLRAAGFPVSMEELREIAGGEVISRAHFARLLVRKGIAGSIDAVFSRFIGKGKEFYESRACLALAEACALIRASGGLPIVAHPMSLGLRGPALRQELSSAKAAGVAGIEAWHPNHSVKDCRMLARLARSLGMVVTGGSDFHGANVPQRRLGRTAGGREVPDELLETLALHPAAR
jgi:predicted metal-dependent phosphoesterase TrpH